MKQVILDQVHKHITQIMPTIACPPTPLSTRAVGAALLHQFARERFLEEGVDEHFIHEAEESLEELTPDLISFDDDLKDLNDQLCTSGQQQQPLSTSLITQISTPRNNSTTTPSQRSNLNLMNVSDIESQHNTTSQSSVSCNATTDRTFGSTAESDAQFHSIVEQLNHSTATTGTTTSTIMAPSEGGNNSTINNTTTATQRENGVEDTMYMSTNAGKANKICLDQLQSSSLMMVYGRELRHIAEEFARSRQRQTVREQAEGVKLEDLSKQSFLELLEELFRGGVTREKIAVLFFFCTDVALRAVESVPRLVVKLLCWSFNFIINVVCKRVDELGGWDQVLFKRLPKWVVYSVGMTVIFGFLWNLRPSLMSSR